MPQLTFYFKPSCPFCRKVISYLEENKIDIPYKNIEEGSQNREELIKIGGKAQVPCLLIEGEALYESDAIIKWFEENWKNG